MIKSFADKDTGKIFNGVRSKKFGHIKAVAFRKLAMIHTATSLADFKAPPANQLEALKGDRAGQHSIRINDQYRICFVWKADNAHEVEIVDYH